MAQIASRSFWVATPGRGEIRTEMLAPPSADQVLVRTLYTGISRGTESIVFHGLVPDSEKERMRAPFQAGEFPAPVKYGYSSVGRVERGPRDLEGCVVFVLHPHQTCFVVHTSAIHVLPAEVPPARAVLAANLETAINGIWDADVQVGDRVTVVGAGTVGCLTAWLAARIPGCDVELVDINPGREAAARALGVRFATPSSASRDVDVALHCSGSPEGVKLALEISGFEATIADMSWYGSQLVPLALGESFHSRRLTLKSSQVGHVPPERRSRWDTRRRMQVALSLLGHDELETLITGETDFEELPEAIGRLLASPGETLCHRVRYQV